MPIATCIDVKPSRILLRSMQAASAGIGLLGLIVAAAPGILLPFVKVCFSVAAICCAFGSICYLWRLPCRCYRIQVSDRGKLQLLVMPAGMHAGSAAPAEECRFEPVTLAPGSVLLPCLLVLRLKNNSGATIPVMVLPDSISRQDFRALSVACRWIAGR